jgi:hypothetical protein
MNDSPPALYTVTVIWSVLLPSYLADAGLTAPADVEFTVEALAERMRNDFGLGRTGDVEAAMEFLKVARLASETPTGWLIHFRDLGRIDREIPQALLHEYRSTANKTRPVRTARDAELLDEEGDQQEAIFDDT